MPGAAPGTGTFEGVQNDGGHAQVTAQNHSVGRPRQRLAGFGSRPLLNFMERSVNGKPAVSKTATAGSSPACSAISARSPRSQGSGPQNRHAPVRVRPVSPSGVVVKSGSQDARIVQFRGQSPAAPPDLLRGIISRESALAGIESRRGRRAVDLILAAMPKCRGAGSSIRLKRVRVPSRPPIDCGDAERFGSRLLTCPLWVRIPPPQNFVPR